MAPSSASTSINEIPKIRSEAGEAFRSRRSKSIAYRKRQLLSLAYLVQDNTVRFQEALATDLGRPHKETTLQEFGATLSEIMTAYHNVEKWAKTDTPFSLKWWAMSPKIRKEPKGVVLVVSPFNYPIFLSLEPLAGAIAAGNACIIKPSELVSATSALLAELIPRYLDPEMYHVVVGDATAMTKLLESPWDHILYTGGGRVARIILGAAAKTLSPASTELGGKSPAIVDRTCDLETSVRRILWAKTGNAGQICVAPDYAIVGRDYVDQFVGVCIAQLEEFYPGGARQSDSYSRIINDRHFERIKTLLDDTRGRIVYGGGMDVESRFIEPTIVLGVGEDDSLMSEEIFGPILPIVVVDHLDEAIDFVNSRDHPLALYVFSKDAAFKSKVLENTQSGSCVMNDCIVHVLVDGIPFGGIGASGSAMHTGKYTFDMFTHFRSTMDCPSWMDRLLDSRYPPFTETKIKKFERLFPSIPPRNTHDSEAVGYSFKWILVGVFAFAITGFALVRS